MIDDPLIFCCGCEKRFSYEFVIVESKKRVIKINVGQQKQFLTQKKSFNINKNLSMS